MSTRSAIITTAPTGYAGIYSHSDGYLSWMGNILFHRITTHEQASALVALGSIRGLDCLGEAEAYVRDCGETPSDANATATGKTAAAVAKQIGHDGHVYLFENGEWSHNGKPLIEVLTRPDIAADIVRLNSQYPDLPPPLGVNGHRSLVNGKEAQPPTSPMTIDQSTSDGGSAAHARFAFRSYQREDLARSAVHDGAIIAWDPGLGKTMAIFAWPYLKHAKRVLIVAPASLHDQIKREGESKFGTSVTPIPDQETALTLMRSGKLPLPGHQSMVNGHWEDKNRTSSPMTSDQSTSDSAALPRFFITDYRWLGYNGGDEWSDGEGDITDVIRRRRMAVIARHFGMPASAVGNAEKALSNCNKACPAHILLSVAVDAPRSVVKSAYRELARLSHPDLHPEDPTATARMQRLNAALESMLKGHATQIVKGLDDEVAEAAPTIAALMAGIGTVREYHASPMTNDQSTNDHTIKCLFTPTLSTLLADCFDCVVCDEAVRLKSGVTYIASGVLGLRSRYRLALTGTPIKNRLPDIFFLASWVCGNSTEPTARWPYGNTTANRAAFANNHLVMEQNLTKEEKSRDEGNFKSYRKQTNKITNVHRLWKLLGPIVARRRKDHIGNDIVNKLIHPIRVQPGTEQQAVYKWHLSNPPVCATPIAALGAQLQCLRQAALCPWSASLARHGHSGAKSAIKWSPKMLAILHLAADLMAKGEQLVVFSPFQEFSTALKAALIDASVPSLLLDGRVKNTLRGPLAADFKARKYPVLIAGIDAMGEGHSFECASHLVIPSLSWAYDANRQATDRVHRLTSKKDVTIYALITANSIDERLAAIFQEKGDASDLALDGRLFDDDKEEVSLADLIRSATLDFDPSAATLPESSLVNEWDLTLRSRLQSAARFFSRSVGVPPTTKATTKPAAANKSSLASCVSSQPDLFTLMPSTHIPPDSSDKSDTHLPSSNPESRVSPNKIIPFPGKPVKKPRPKLTPEQARRLVELML
ncbi:MAG: SNF2-related protein [Verrucomicrobiota bacterium]